MRYYIVTRQRATGAGNLGECGSLEEARKLLAEAREHFGDRDHLTIWEHDTEDQEYAEEVTS